MKIKFFADVFLKQSKLIQDVCTKKNPITESIIFDFENSLAYMRNDLGTKALRIKFNYEILDEDTEKIKLFYVDAEKFLNVCNHYVIFNFDICQTKDTQSLKIYKDSSAEIIEIPFEFTNNQFELDDFDFSNENPEIFDFEFDENIRSQFKKSIKYMENDVSKHADLCGIFLKNNHLFSSNTRKMFDYKLEKSIPDFNFTLDMIKIFLNQVRDIYTIKKYSNFLTINLDEFTDIKLANNLHLFLSKDPEDKSFVSFYQSPYSFTIDKNILNKTLSFLEFWVRDLPGTRMNFILDSISKKIKIKITGSNYIEKEVDLVEISEELNNYDFWISHTLLKNVVDDLGGENITFQLKPELSNVSPPINCLSDKDKNLHIVICKSNENI